MDSSFRNVNKSGVVAPKGKDASTQKENIQFAILQSVSSSSVRNSRISALS